MKFFKHLFGLKAQALMIVAIAITIGFRFAGEHGALAGAAVSFLSLELMGGVLIRNARGQCLGDNAIASELQVNTFLDAALLALRQPLLALRSFSTVFNNVPLSGTNKISVPYYPLDTAPSKDFAGTYVFDGSETQAREVTVDRRKYKPFSFTSAEIARQPMFDPEQLGTQKGQQIAEDVIADILSIVTAENFGAAVFTGAASTFDSDDVSDIREKCTQAKWPKTGRSLILDATYYTPLTKDGSIKNAQNYGGSEAIRQGIVPVVSGFGIHETNLIPANGENLKGIAVYQSAILCAFSPIQPAKEVMERLTRYETRVDPDTNITLEYREWGDADSDAVKRLIEVNYGFALGEAAALKRIVSA
jgi:hypothetical protein